VTRIIEIPNDRWTSFKATIHFERMPALPQEPTLSA